jgi:DNA-binding transcriptional LysR family regulator
MNLDQLRAFHKVATAGSFTKAARELCLTQSAVSQQVRALEEKIGGTLFDRSGKKICLTGEGEVLLTYAERLFALHEEIESLFGGLQTLRKGKVAVAASGAIGTYFMPAIIRAYNRRHPGIEIDLRMGNSDRVQQMILDHEVDFGIGGMIRDQAALQAIHLHREKLLVVCSPRDPLAAQ